MKAPRAAASLALAGLAALPLAAGAAEALAEQHGCSLCHQVDRKLVGPSFKAVAERYRGQPDAAERLRAKVAQGGVGVWGNVPMPAMGHVPAADTDALLAWILKL